MNNYFLKRVSELIEDKTARKQINTELESHLLDKIDYYTEIGYTHEEAAKKATEEMGNPDDTAVPLNSMNKKGIQRNIWSIVTAVFAIFIALLSFNVIPIEHSFRYGDASFAIYHRVSIDFLSLFICAVYLLLLYKAYRQKNIFSAALLSLSLLVMAAAYFPDMRYPAFQFSLFQPLYYPAAMIIMHGLSAFYDSIFAYSYIPDSDRLFYNCGAVGMYLILLAVAVTLFVAILRQSRMKTVRRLRLPIKIAKSGLCIFLLVDLLVLSVATIPALTSLNTKRDEMQTAKERAIHYVINADLSNGTEPFIDRLLSDGYEYYYSEDNIWQSGQKTLHSGFNDSLIITTDSENNPYICYAPTDFDPFFIFEGGDVCLGLEERKQIKTNMTIDEFMTLGFYTKAIMVSKSVYPDNEEQNAIDFSFDLPGEGYDDFQCHFGYDSSEKKYYLTGTENMKEKYEEAQTIFGESENYAVAG